MGTRARELIDQYLSDGVTAKVVKSDSKMNTVRLEAYSAPVELTSTKNGQLILTIGGHFKIVKDKRGSGLIPVADLKRSLEQIYAAKLASIDQAAGYRPDRFSADAADVFSKLPGWHMQ